MYRLIVSAIFVITIIAQDPAMNEPSDTWCPQITGMFGNFLDLPIVLCAGDEQYEIAPHDGVLVEGLGCFKVHVPGLREAIKVPVYVPYFYMHITEHNGHIRINAVGDFQHFLHNEQRIPKTDLPYNGALIEGLKQYKPNLPDLGTTLEMSLHAPHLLHNEQRILKTDSKIAHLTHVLKLLTACNDSLDATREAMSDEEE